MKKKGLIISTIVMVIVLVASLTTATYAWFSSQAQATVESITVQTVAVEGLQVAVKTGNTAADWASGTISYAADGAAFSGSVSGWGSLVDFSDAVANGVGEMDNAVTEYRASADGSLGATPLYVEKTDATFADLANLYILEDGKMVSQAGAQHGGANVTSDTFEAWATGKTFYVSDSATYDYVKPIDYDANINAYAYEAAIANGTTAAGEKADYIQIPIGVKTTAEMQYICCTITITPELGNVPTAYDPGMAAAARVKIVPKNVETGAEITDNDGTVAEFYEGTTTSTTGFTKSGENTYSFVVAQKGTNNISIGEAFLNEFTIWVEGTDGQCIQAVAGSGFDVNIAFVFVEASATSGTDYTLSGTTLTITGGASYSIVDGLTQTAATPQA